MRGVGRASGHLLTHHPGTRAGMAFHGVSEARTGMVRRRREGALERSAVALAGRGKRPLGCHFRSRPLASPDYYRRLLRFLPAPFPFPFLFLAAFAAAFSSNTACAAASRAMGTLKGEQLT